jgi:diguanylate cyclase (GGDEF)-like protein/PAS domain S-box-containing protein
MHELAALVTVAYPVGDLVLILAITSVTLRATSGLSRRAGALLGSAILVILAADLAFGILGASGEWVAGDPITLLMEIPLNVAYLLVALSAGVAAREARTTSGGTMAVVTRPGRLSALPYLAVLLGYGLLLWVSFGQLEDRVQGLIFGAVILTGLVVARQVVAVRENGRLLAAQATRRSEARFSALVQQSSDVITIVDADGRVAYQSPSVTRVFGYPPEQVIGRQVVDLLHPDDREDAAVFLDAARRASSTGLTINWRIKHRDGGWRQVETVVANLLDHPDVAGLVLTSRDDTERRTLADQLRHQAFHDTLTGLPNRALLEDRLTQALARAARSARPVAVLSLDLDNFKTVNDSLGHLAGDEVLVTIGQRIGRLIRGADTAARFGGDEFAVLLEDLPAGVDPVTESAQVAQRLLDACRAPMTIQEREVAVGCSIGIAISDAGIESPDDLLRAADVAMYNGKERGRGRYEVFEPEMHARILDRLELESDLRLAIERRELVVYYQPIVALETHAIVGVEALVRWDHPRRGFLPPGAFIPTAEETGLIVPLGALVLRQACADARRWQERCPASPPLTVTVNLSTRQLDDPGCVEDVRRALGESGLPPASLTLEITESFMMNDPDAAIARLAGLKRLGVQVALDDFGTGFSSLSYLQRLPVDVLKIDKTFVDRMASTGRDTSLVEAILTLGRSLRLKTVAEGIERPDQLTRLRALGCTYGQGYLLSRPRERAAIDALLAEQQAGPQAGQQAGPPPAPPEAKVSVVAPGIAAR